jgi:hypothetical protein
MRRSRLGDPTTINEGPGNTSSRGKSERPEALRPAVLEIVVARRESGRGRRPEERSDDGDHDSRADDRTRTANGEVGERSQHRQCAQCLRRD